MAEVVVTGGSGFVGSWVIIELLRQGFLVRRKTVNTGGEDTLHGGRNL